MQELNYHQNGDYLIPDLEAPEAPRMLSSDNGLSPNIGTIRSL